MKPSETWREDTAARAEEAIGYTFSDKALLVQCFTHRSFTTVSGEPHNERLEFLGDAVLGFLVSEELFLRVERDEGRLTELRKRFVSREALSVAAGRAGLVEFLRYAGGEDAVGGKTPSNLFEAVVAGIYLDGGMEEARRFLGRFLKEIDEGNYKSLLQEYVQGREKHPPAYETAETAGGYRCKVSALGAEAEGFGQSKKLAETAAAERLLKFFKERTE